MKGPFERLKYDLRRVWECPECHHKERAGGSVTTMVCRCQAAKEPSEQVFMQLVEDRIQRRFPIYVPPTDTEPLVADADQLATDTMEADTPPVSPTADAATKAPERDPAASEPVAE